MSWTSADVKLELQAMSKLLHSRPGVHELEDKLCQSLKAKLDHMTFLSNADLVLCYDSLKEATLPAKMNDELLASLDALAVSRVDNSGSAKLASAGQECKTFEKYLTESDLSQLATCSMWEGCQVICRRLRLLGITGMKESLKKICLGVLVWHEQKRTKQMPCPDSVYALGHHLLQVLHTIAVEVPEKAMSLAKYPDDPLHLDAAHFSAAYPEGGPAKKDFPQLALIIQKNIKIRSTASCLAKDPWFLVMLCYFVMFLCSHCLCVCVLVLHSDNQHGFKESVPQQAPAAQSEQPSAGSKNLVDQSLVLMINRFTEAACGILGTHNKSKEATIEILQPGQQAAQPSRTDSSQSLVGSHLPLENDRTMNEKKGCIQEACKAKSDHGGVEQKVATLEECEEANMKKLLEREEQKSAKKGGTTKAKAQAAKMKRPACCKPKAQPKKVAKSVAATHVEVKKGCKRCRGNRNGCVKCLDPAFTGMRLTRQEWVAHAKAHGWK